LTTPAGPTGTEGETNFVIQDRTNWGVQHRPAWKLDESVLTEFRKKTEKKGKECALGRSTRTNGGDMTHRKEESFSRLQET